MTGVRVDPRAIVEDAQAYLPVRPSTARLEADDVVLRHTPGLPPHWFGSATRIRFSPGSVEARQAAVRDWFAAQGRQAFNWQIGPSSSPDDLEARLVAAGARPEPDDPDGLAMLLESEPPPGPPGVAVRRVATFNDYRSASRIVMHDAPPADWEAAQEGIERSWVEARDDRMMYSYLVEHDGVPIAMAQMVWLTVGLPYLGGATTLPDARGRGAFRALVRRRWDDAVEAGVPILLVQAGRMSSPILRRLGFRAVAPTRILVDTVDPAASASAESE
jgi:hypothetical protein